MHAGNTCACREHFTEHSWYNWGMTSFQARMPGCQCVPVSSCPLCTTPRRAAPHHVTLRCAAPRHAVSHAGMRGDQLYLQAADSSERDAETYAYKQDNTPARLRTVPHRTAPPRATRRTAPGHAMPRHMSRVAPPRHATCDAAPRHTTPHHTTPHATHRAAPRHAICDAAPHRAVAHHVTPRRARHAHTHAQMHKCMRACACTRAHVYTY